MPLLAPLLCHRPGWPAAVAGALFAGAVALATPAESSSAPPRPAVERLSDRLSDTLAVTVDGAAEWLDSRFGPASPTREEPHGHLRVVPLWVDGHGVDWETRLRLRVDLPNIDRRLHAVFGAGDSDNFMTERATLASLEEMAILKERFGDRSFLAGLGYALRETERSSLRLGVGARFDFPIEPYARVRYTHRVALGGHTLVRLHQTLYARSQRGEGSITGADIEHVLSPTRLVRAAAFAHYSTWDERPEEYGTEFSLAQALRGGRVVAATVFGYYEPRAAVPLRDYGTRLIYRWRVSRDRLFAEIHTGVTWPRYTRDERRRAALNLGLGVELHFGPRPR